MAITIDKLIERLEDLREELDGNGQIEVRLMHQPEWPFEYDIAGVVSTRDIRDGDPDEDDPDEDESFTPQGDADEVVYICEGRQLDYGSKTAWAAL
jgi:hypothetical protein